MDAFRVLIVCTANVCRSPAAQRFLQRSLLPYGAVVESAGTMAIDGNAADETISRLMLERGYDDIQQHRSRTLMPSHTHKYHLILCMEKEHLARVQSLNPSVLGRSKLMGHWDGQSEVDDPVGRSVSTYEKSLDKMEILAQQWASKMREMGFVS